MLMVISHPVPLLTHAQVPPTTRGDNDLVRLL